MKKILYICTNFIENWEIFIPATDGRTTKITLSLLLLHKEQNLEKVSVSQIWNLNGSEQDGTPKNPHKNISYQEFLEEVFSHDLSVVL